MKMATSKTAQNIQAAQPTIKLLETIDQKGLLLRVLCEDCKSTFTHDVAFVLRMTRSTGFFIPSSLCRACRKKRKAGKKEKKPQQQTKKQGSKKAKSKKVHAKAKKLTPVATQASPEVPQKAAKPSTGTPTVKSSVPNARNLTHRPFEGLKNLLHKEEKVLTPAQKSAATRKKNLLLIEKWVTAKLNGQEPTIDLDAKLLARAEKKLASLKKTKK